MASTTLEDLRHALKMKFKLPPDRPTDDELISIIKDAKNLSFKELKKSDTWAEIVNKYVKFEGFYLYEGLDFSDINALYQQLLSQLGR